MEVEWSGEVEVKMEEVNFLTSFHKVVEVLREGAPKRWRR